MAEEDGRTGSHPEAERRKGCHPLQLPRPEQAVQGHCPQGRPFSDECAFVTGDKDLDAKFVAEAKAAGLENLKGHRTVGGMRASIYNAMPVAGVEALVAFMKKFEAENA